jgi:hypothetical protein
MRFDKASVGLPHDLLELPELAEKPRVGVVDLLGIIAKGGMLIRLDVPKAVGKGTALGTCDFLLFRSPFRELDLVREQNTTSHDVNKLELGINSAEAFLSYTTLGLLLDDLDTEEVVGITVEALVAVSGDFILPLSLRDRGTDIMRVKSAMGGKMVETKDGTVLNVWKLGEVAPGIGSVDGFAMDVKGLGLILKKPDVVVIFVGIKGDLLLLGSGRVHERVGV